MLNSYCGLKEDVVVLRKMRINENVSLNRSASRLLVVLRKKNLFPTINRVVNLLSLRLHYGHLSCCNVLKDTQAVEALRNNFYSGLIFNCRSAILQLSRQGNNTVRSEACVRHRQRSPEQNLLR